MKQLTNQAQKDKLCDIEEVLKKFILSDQDRRKFVDFRELINKADTNIRRGIRQFDSTIAVVIVVGMLKSGKSTLINLFARNTNASPVGFGVDTTLRPALIKMREKSGVDSDGKGKIYIYTPILPRKVNHDQLEAGQVGANSAPSCPAEADHVDPTNGSALEEENTSDDEDKQFKNALHGVMDELRGITSEPGEYLWTKKVCDLSQENLRDALCKRRSDIIRQEPILVVIDLPYNEDAELLKDGIYLLDMPGLDSANSAISQKLDTRYADLVNECDMVLCLQSSVAPLNRPAVDCFRKVLAKRNVATAWVIQNIMTCKPWLTEAQINKEKDEQKEQANEVITKISPNVAYSAVNLGQAFAALLVCGPFLKLGETLPDGTKIESGKDGELFKKSGFAGLEQDMINQMRDSGTATRFLHCKQALSDKTEKIIQELEKYRDTQQKDEQTKEKRRANWECIKKWINDEINQDRTCSAAQCVQLRKSLIEKRLKDNQRPLVMPMSDADGEENVTEINGSIIDRYLKDFSNSCRQNAEALLKNIEIEWSEVVESGESTGSTKEAVKRERDEILVKIKQYIGDIDSKEGMEGIMKDEEKSKLKDTVQIESPLIVNESFIVPKGKSIDYVSAPRTFERYYIKINKIRIRLWEKPYKKAEREISRCEDQIVQGYYNQVKNMFSEGKDEWLDKILKNSVRASLRVLKKEVEEKVVESGQACLELQEHLRKVNEILDSCNEIQTDVNEL